MEISKICIILVFVTYFSIDIQSQILQKNDSISLDVLLEQLPEVIVRGEAPLIKMSDEKLIFDIQKMIDGKPVTNSFELLKEVPGVLLNGNDILILGAHSTSVIINSHKTSMTIEQIVDYLKSIPSARVKKVEIMYNAPAKYGVKGACINIILDQDKTINTVFKSEIELKASQAFYFSPFGAANLSLSGKKYLFDFSYLLRYDDDRTEQKMKSLHSIKEREYTIEQDNYSRGKYLIHRINFGFDYMFGDDRGLKFNYSTNLLSSTIESHATTDITTRTPVESKSLLDGPRATHNLSLGLSRSKFDLNIDYTHYMDETNQLLNNIVENKNEKIESSALQKTQKVDLHLGHEISLTDNKTLNYGLNGIFSQSDNEQYLWFDDKRNLKNKYKAIQREYSLDTYLGCDIQFTEKLILNASISLQYFNSKLDSICYKRNLWNDFNVFPNFTFLYKIKPGNTLQLSMSSERNYPSYWQMTSNRTYQNIYSVIDSNPFLKPYITFSSRINYILLSKYMFGVFSNNSPDYIQQMPYQSENELLNVFESLNVEFHNIYGAMVVVPFSVHKNQDSKITLMAAAVHDKGSFHEIDFNRKKIFSRIVLDNNIYLKENKNIAFNISGYYTSPTMQGIYDIGHLFDLSLGLVCKLANEKLLLTIQASDLLNTNIPLTSIHLNKQNSEMTLFQDTRKCTVSLRYNFGKYERKNNRSIDISRFGTQ